MSTPEDEFGAYRDEMAVAADPSAALRALVAQRQR